MMKTIATTALVAVLACSEAPDPAAYAVEDDTRITLARGACYGPCPIYEVSVDAKGNVTFVGTRYVSAFGKHQSAISPAEVKQLATKFAAIDFFALQDSYDQDQRGCRDWVTDHPTAIITFQSGRRTKRVSHYHGCRDGGVLEQLTALENEIDARLGIEAWIRLDESAESRRRLVERFGFCKDAATCEARAKKLDRGATLAMHETDQDRFRSRQLLLCNDGTLHLSDSQLRWLGGLGFIGHVEDPAAFPRAKTPSSQPNAQRSYEVGHVDGGRMNVFGIYDGRASDQQRALAEAGRSMLERDSLIRQDSRVRITPMPIDPATPTFMRPMKGDAAPDWLIRAVNRDLTANEWREVEKQLTIIDPQKFDPQQFLDGAPFGLNALVTLHVSVDGARPRPFCE